MLKSSAIFVSHAVVSELRDIAQCQDGYCAAASIVLAAQHHYTVEDPYQRTETPDSRPTFSFDDGEADGIVLGNALDLNSVTSSHR